MIRCAIVLCGLIMAASPLAHGQTAARGTSGAGAPVPAASTEDPAKSVGNYLVRIEWKDVKATTNHLELLTTEGQVSLDSVLPEKVRIDESEIPVTISVNSTLRVLSPEKGRLTLYLGRTIPYVTGTMQSAGGKSSSFQQMRVGLSSTIEVTFGKRHVIQSDPAETVTVLVRRVDG